MKSRIALALLAAVMLGTSASAGWSWHRLPSWNQWSACDDNNQQQNEDCYTYLPVLIFDGCKWKMSWIRKPIVCDNTPPQTNEDCEPKQDPKDWFKKKHGWKWCKPVLPPVPNDCEPKDKDKDKCPTGVPTPGAAGAGLAMLGMIAARRRRQA